MSDPQFSDPGDADGAAPLTMELAVVRHGSRDAAERAVAREIVDLVERRPEAVLGLATGGTMVGVYRAMVELARERSVPFGAVRTFNLDEYLGDLEPALTFRGFMGAHLFDALGVSPRHVHFPDAQRASADPLGAARAYEDAIAAAGGIDLQLLGIGRNGHIAFNEPPSSIASRTRVVPLEGRTREDAAASFGGVERVPSHAITMGVATILECRALRVLAFGGSKAEIVRSALHAPMGPDLPVTFARQHPNASLHVDPLAAALL